MQLLDAVAPEAAQALVHERDEHMAEFLFKLASPKDAVKAQQSNIVAVVGLAHLDGVERHFQDRVLEGGMQ